MTTLNLFPCEERPSLLELESLVRRQGYACIAGIDEAGRGPLAGPVVAAAVILPNGVDLPGVNDSKKLSPGKRDELYDLIWKRTIASQMADAVLEKTTITIGISGAPEKFIARGEVIKFDGFLKVYMESTDEEENRDEEKILPPPEDRRVADC